MNTYFIIIIAILLVGGIVLNFTRRGFQGNRIVIPAGGLNFVSSSGKLVAKIDYNQSGGAIFIFNQNEKPVGSLSVNGDNAAIRLYNRQGQMIWGSGQN